MTGNCNYNPMLGRKRSGTPAGKGDVFVLAVSTRRCLEMPVEMDKVKAWGVIRVGEEVPAMAGVGGETRIPQKEKGRP